MSEGGMLGLGEVAHQLPPPHVHEYERLGQSRLLPFSSRVSVT
ncbi:hypothetical protein [Streptomyces griseoruber]